MKKTILKTTGMLLCVLFTAFNFTGSMQHLQNTASTVYYDTVNEKNSIISSLNSALLTAKEEIPVAVSGDERLSKTEEVTVSLFGVLPIKKVTFTKKDDIVLVPCGNSVGISIDINGLLVVGTGEVVVDAAGRTVQSPAAAAGINPGDYIIAANDKQLTDSDALADACKNCEGTITLTIMREESIKKITVNPAIDSGTETYKLGVWVREDTAGIGTLSYYNPDDMSFAALGHPITDVDTGNIFPVRSGSICDCEIVGITKGASGTPGELTGMFSSYSDRYGRINSNTEFGVFGKLTDANALNVKYPNGLRLAYPDELHTGNATILCSPNGDNTEEYSCRIVKLSNQSEPAIKGIIVEITDERLISQTGGIVQGMSGSPIIQDGKLAGVVTHVMINNPLRGYGIYAYWMYLKQCG